MSRRIRAARSTQAGQRIDRFAEAREMLADARACLMDEIHQIDGMLERLAAIQATPRLNPKRSLKDLFEARDLTKPGSTQEERAAQKILEAVFPDTNGG